MRSSSGSNATPAFAGQLEASPADRVGSRVATVRYFAREMAASAYGFCTYVGPVRDVAGQQGFSIRCVCSLVTSKLYIRLRWEEGLLSGRWI